MRERLAAHPWIGPLKPTAQRAAHVTTPLRFFAREALHRPAVGSYRLRLAPAVPAVLRHGTRDLETFDQVFRQGSVAPPPVVAERLRALGRPPRVLDLGANIGSSAGWFAATFPGATVICVEPDPANLAVLQQASALAAPPWTVLCSAASNTEGELRFAFTGDSVSRASAGDDGVLVRALDAIRLAVDEQIDLVKIDIEGGEWAILGDQRLGALPAVAIALEYHAHLCPRGASPRETAIAALQRAGYETHEVPHVAGAPAEEGSLWAVRPTPAG